MKNETLKLIINQIKKYKLTNVFEDVESFKKWILTLNNIQINNFINLNIDLDKIKNLNHLLINYDLLNCIDYKERINAISMLKNGDGCWHLFDTLCKPNFLKSKNFYHDIEMLSKADTARYCLWILSDDNFINSPYHNEDLKLLVKTHDVNKVRPLDFVVLDALATVASNINSINSPYHQADMKLIAATGSNCLQSSHTYPKYSLNSLAINKESLLDKYHLENMKILANKPIASEFLYILMTEEEIIKGKYYRKEIDALVKAKSKHTARALYYYIVNPRKKFTSDHDFYNDYEYNRDEASIEYSECISGKNDPDYINNLTKINKIDDCFVMHYISLLMNPTFLNSNYKKFDLELLQNISNISIFMDLYRLMTDQNSLNGIHHKKDAIIISQTTTEKTRKLLLEKACDKDSLNSNNHEYDMNFISKLQLDNLRDEIYNEIRYYLFNEKGINDPNHKEKLVKLSQGILVERNNSVDIYLDSLENQIVNNKDNNSPIIESIDDQISKPKFKILKLFKK